MIVQSWPRYERTHYTVFVYETVPNCACSITNAAHSHRLSPNSKLYRTTARKLSEYSRIGLLVGLSHAVMPMAYKERCAVPCLKSLALHVFNMKLVH